MLIESIVRFTLGIKDRRVVSIKFTGDERGPEPNR